MVLQSIENFFKQLRITGSASVNNEFEAYVDAPPTSWLVLRAPASITLNNPYLSLSFTLLDNGEYTDTVSRSNFLICSTSIFYLYDNRWVPLDTVLIHIKTRATLVHMKKNIKLMYF